MRIVSELWVIFDHPRDYPNHFVLRRQLVIAADGGKSEIQFDQHAYLFETIQEARAALPDGLVCLGRNYADDPVISETWI